MIPVGIAGFFLKRYAEKYFTGNMISLGITVLISALLLFMTLLIKPKERPIGYIDSFIIGIAQAIAVLPGDFQIRCNNCYRDDDWKQEIRYCKVFISDGLGPDNRSKSC